MAQITYYAPAGVTSINLSDGSRAVVVNGQITADEKFCNELQAAGCTAGQKNAVTTAALASINVASTDNSVALLGDSITLRNQQGATANFNAEGYFVVANMLMRQKYDLIGVYATSGYTIEQIAATHLPQIISSGAKTCFVLAGTNNAADALPETIFDKLTSLIWKPLRAAGINVWAATIPPNGTWTTAQSAKMAAVNDMIRAAKSTWPGLRVADFWAATVDGLTGAPRANLFGDQIHPVARGGMYYARAIADSDADSVVKKTARVSGGALDPYILSANPLAFGNNANGTNGTVIGTGGTGTGPNQWSVQSNNAATTFTCSGNNARSPVDFIDGKALDVSATFGGDDHYIQIGALNGADIYLDRAWSATTARVAGMLVRPTAGRTGWQYKAVTSGTTGSSEPAWPTSLGATVTDGTVTWMAIKDVAAGDIYEMVVELVFSAMSGSVCPWMRVNFDTNAYDGSLRPGLIANGAIVLSNDANTYSPSLTIGTAIFDYVPLNEPIVIRSQPIVAPAGVVGHVAPIFRLYGKNGTTATFKVQQFEFRRKP